MINNAMGDIRIITKVYLYLSHVINAHLGAMIKLVCYQSYENFDKSIPVMSIRISALTGHIYY